MRGTNEAHKKKEEKRILDPLMFQSILLQFQLQRKWSISLSV